MVILQFLKMCWVKKTRLANPDPDHFLLRFFGYLFILANGRIFLLLGYFWSNEFWYTSLTFLNILYFSITLLSNISDTVHALIAPLPIFCRHHQQIPSHLPFCRKSLEPLSFPTTGHLQLITTKRQKFTYVPFPIIFSVPFLGNRIANMSF